MSLTAVNPAATSERPPSSWIEFLQKQIDPSWRPGEYDHSKLIYTPDLANPFTSLVVCRKRDCGTHLASGQVCPSCRADWQRLAPAGAMDWEAWLEIPRIRRQRAEGCVVQGCQRDHSGQGLCASHCLAARSWSKRNGVPYDVAEWIVKVDPAPFDARPICRAVTCGWQNTGPHGLCGMHAERYRRWVRLQPGDSSSTIDRWFQLEVEVPLGGAGAPTYAATTATPFYLLDDPVRSELLFATQQRDVAGTSMLTPVILRSIYMFLRRSGVNSLVGLDQLGYHRAPSSNFRGVLRELQARIDGAHRRWSGVPGDDSGMVYFSDLTLRRSSRHYGLKAKVDLSKIRAPWIYETVTAWMHAAARTPNKVSLVASAWTIVDEVIGERGTRVAALSRADMDAIHRSIVQRWENGAYQRRHLSVIREIIEYGRENSETLTDWLRIPSSFSLDRARHQPNGSAGGSAANADEPFRFVPQPVVDWVMDHIGLYSRSTAYQTAEARVMIFLQERCGRRPGETLKLRNDCISFDDAGAPYLEWQEGKPPYGRGKRLPIHPETHEVIREWQALKLSAGIESDWLFPNTRGRRAGIRHKQASFLNDRVRELMNVLLREAPFEASVIGAEGNLVHFNLNTIDSYSFRHAFAQRLADAEDERGQSTTSPDVLQDFMGHKNFNTTMAYFQVTAKRRKRTLAAITPRRLDVTGTPIAFDNERATFGKLAVSLGTCTEPVTVKSGGEACVINHACESCPFFLVDPLERDGITAKRLHLKAQLERFTLIAPESHMVAHLENRIDDCNRIVSGIDRYIDSLSEAEQQAIRVALETMEDVRRRATASRTIDLRVLLMGGPDA